MINILPMILALIGGLVIGAVFYGGLWWTVKKRLTSSHAGIWFMLSFWLRLAIATAGFYLIGQGDWKRFLVCFLGFLIARILVTLLTKERNYAT